MNTLTHDRKVNDSVSYHKLSQALIGTKNFNPDQIIQAEPYFRYVGEKDPSYVDPNFTVVEQANGSTNSQIILISAAGATGKTALATRLSQDLQIPIFDLAQDQSVGQYSLMGMFAVTLGPQGYTDFTTAIQQGRAALIIDALDEGRIKTAEKGYNDFLDDIIRVAKDAEGVAFILMGRGQVVDHTWLYLAEHGLSSTLLQIAPFTSRQAEEFIDLRITAGRPDKYTTAYVQVKNHIIASIESFFSSPNKNAQEQYQAFIGYAPVLKSIVTLLENEQNYLALYERLKSNENKGMALVIDIIEDILEREREMKVKKQVLPGLLENRPPEVKSEVLTQAFNNTEQCARLLARRLSQPISLEVCSDARTNELYNERIAEWLGEHPFLNNGKIENSVFESYILSVLIDDGGYAKLVDEYFQRYYKGAFMLFFIYEQLARSKNIALKYVPYLYDSVKSLDSPQFRSFLSIDADEFEDDVDSQSCEIEIKIITPQDFKIFDHDTSIKRTDRLQLSGVLSGLFISVPISVQLTGPKVVLSPSIDVRCKDLIINAAEISLEKGLLDNGLAWKAKPQNQDPFIVDLENSSHDIIFDCEVFEIDYANAPDPRVANYLGNNQKFIIFNKTRPPHPFNEFYDAEGCIYVADDVTREKYLRFRRIVTTLRSHSKGVLARYKEKILHRRILKNEVGEQILASLLALGILYDDQKFYYWDPTKANQHLGIDYKGISKMRSTAKLDKFLQGI